ncbi:MAG: TetR/AcrR family transcriptional regulator, partial [Eggerthellaceae bacterium]|nr:TetR/AcrR family transcriptional regulator [Eggerthellaceae bacterium]
QRENFCTLVKAVPGKDFSTDFLTMPSISMIFQNLAIVKGYPQPEGKYIREFITQGIFAMLCEWLGSDKPEPASEIAGVLVILRDRLIY